MALMNERKKRVLDEPNFGENMAVVKIRHPLLGTKTRLLNGDSHENPHIGWAALAKHQNTSILSITVEKEYHQKK